MKKYIILIFIILVILILYKYNRENYPSYQLPKIIWSYWDSINTIPPKIMNMINDRNKVLYDWETKLITNESIDKYIPSNSYPKNYNLHTSQHKADWIRLYLLNNYGGVWLDASIIINSRDEFNKIYENSVKNKSMLTAYYIGDNPYDFIENWFIMAPINSYIITKWYNEFSNAIEIGFDNYKSELLNKKIRVSHIYDVFGTYLTMHAAMQKLIQMNEIEKSDIILYSACESMYKIQCDCQWNKECIINKLSDTNYINSLPFIKLRGIDRD